MKILSFVGKRWEGILIGGAVANFMWGIQPKYSQGLILVQEGMKAPFYLIGIMFILFYLLMRLYNKFRASKTYSTTKEDSK